MRIAILLLVLVLALATVLMLAPPQAQAATPPWECAFARYSPAFAFLCAYRLLMDTWNPLDWDD